MEEYKLWGPIHRHLKNHKVREEETKLYGKHRWVEN